MQVRVRTVAIDLSVCLCPSLPYMRPEQSIDPAVGMHHVGAVGRRQRQLLQQPLVAFQCYRPGPGARRGGQGRASGGAGAGRILLSPDTAGAAEGSSSRSVAFVRHPPPSYSPSPIDQHPTCILARTRGANHTCICTDQRAQVHEWCRASRPIYIASYS